MLTGAQALQLALTEQQLDRLIAFVALLRKWNRSFNFISRQDIDRIIPRHILDSLTGARLLHGQRVLDLGSGAGLPGMVLAIAQPERHFVLCDRSERRMRFCAQVIQQLSLDNAEVWVGDVKPADKPDGVFDTVVSRGVATATVVWDIVQGLLAADGRVVLYASTCDETDQEQDQDDEAAGEPRADERAAAKDSKDTALSHDLTITQHHFQIEGVQRTHNLLCLERA